MHADCRKRPRVEEVDPASGEPIVAWSVDPVVSAEWAVAPEVLAENQNQPELPADQLLGLPGHDAPLVEHMRAWAAFGVEIMPRRPVDGGRKLLDILTGQHRTGLTTPAMLEGYLAEQGVPPAFALCTGPRSSLLIVDIDCGHANGIDGLASWRALEATHGTVCAPVAFSPNGGRHLLFSYPNGVDIKATRAIAPGIEVLGKRGAINAPPSRKRIRDGQIRPYLWSLAQHPNWLPMPEPPEWLLELAVPRSLPKPKPSKHRKVSGDARYVQVAVDRELATVASTPAGTRNVALNRATFACARFVRDGRLALCELKTAMLDAATDAGLPQREAEATIRSAIWRARP